MKLKFDLDNKWERQKYDKQDDYFTMDCEFATYKNPDQTNPKKLTINKIISICILNSDGEIVLDTIMNPDDLKDKNKNILFDYGTHVHGIPAERIKNASSWTNFSSRIEYILQKPIIGFQLQNDLDVLFLFIKSLFFFSSRL